MFNFLQHAARAFTIVKLSNAIVIHEYLDMANSLRSERG